MLAMGGFDILAGQEASLSVMFQDRSMLFNVPVTVPLMVPCLALRLAARSARSRGGSLRFKRAGHVDRALSAMH